MRVLSLFSGVGGMDLGLQRAGHQIVGLCEIDRHARSVLRRHHPDAPIHDDVTTLEGEEWRGRVDVVAGGSPCQDLSVAGRRDGLDGARSGLFWHQCRIADTSSAPWVIWENVVGALSSSGGSDFASVLWGLTGTHPGMPDGARWQSQGVVVGPKRWAAWRVLDAQWFGVPQRRRRLFVVAGPRDVCRPEILLECEGMFGDTPTRPQAEQEIAGTLGTRPQRDDLDNHGAYVVESVDSPMAFVKAKRARSVDDDESWQSDRPAPTLNQFDNGHETRATVLAVEPVSFRWHSSGRAGFDIRSDHVGTLTVGSGLGIPSPPGVMTSSDDQTTVRRLTPRECERLMGFPDDWTRWNAEGHEQADSHRYKQCGNGVVTPVTEWIGRRLMEVAG